MYFEGAQRRKGSRLHALVANVLVDSNHPRRAECPDTRNRSFLSMCREV